MAYYRIVEWSRYQHYKDRDPPWIKLHRDLLTSQTWVMLADAGRALAVACMLVAAGTENRIPADPNYLKRRAYLNKDPDFASLVEVGFLELVNETNDVAYASKEEQTLAFDTKCSSEERREEKRREEGITDSDLEDVREAYAEFVLAAQAMKWPLPRKLDPDRKKKLRARLSEHGRDGWTAMLNEAKASDFLRSKWPLKFDWVLKPENFRKVIEGNYRGTPVEEPPKRVVDWN